MNKPRSSKINSWNLAFFGLLLAVLIPLFFTSPGIAAEASRGEKVYRFKCAKCHGKTGQGDGPMAKLLTPAPANFSAKGFFDSRSDADLKKSILEAKPPMPSFQAEVDSGRLKESDIDAIVQHIKTFSGGS